MATGARQGAPARRPAAVCAACGAPAPRSPCGLRGGRRDDHHAAVFARHQVAAGQVVFMQGEAFRCLYVVRDGLLKSTVMHQDGRVQICAFRMVGDVFALEGIASGVHATTTTAVDDTQICAIAYAPLMTLMATDSALQRRVSQLMSRELSRGHRQMLLLGSLNAQQKLAAFLLTLSQHFDALGCSAHEFQLRMSRAEIGSYLGLKLETVSRTFAYFQDQGLLQVRHRRVQITDLARLSSVYAAL